jgi:MFS family permease
MSKDVDTLSAKVKYSVHGFFISVATTVAEPATILPLMVYYFSGSPLLVGLFASLLKGGSVLVQLFAAFYAQSYPRMMPYLYAVFAARFFAWFFIGVMVYFFGPEHPNIALLSIGIGLFIFSFAAGFGSVYFNEIIAKIFSNKERGKVIAIRQFFMGFGAIASGASAGWILSHFEPPHSFGLLFIFSALLMSIGIFAFASIPEPVKTKVGIKEKRFKTFILNSQKVLKEDLRLRRQIITYLLAYAHLLSLPFIILDVSERMTLDGMDIGLFISAQMSGGMLSNLLWARCSSKGRNLMIIHLSFLLYIFSIVMALASESIYAFVALFFALGAAMDGMRLAFSNMILIIAPEEKRPVYIALQSNLSSIGLFFSIPGALILQYFSYGVLYGVTLVVLVAGFVYSFRLRVEA